MSQDRIRFQILFMKKWKSYGAIADDLGINKHTFYSWLDGNFNLTDEQLYRI